MGNYCETDIIDDAGFQFWCGDALCTWEVEEGAVRKVSTWHEHDYAVELLGAPVVLTQPADGSLPSCVRIELIADVEPSAMVVVAIDYGGNGTIDWSAPIYGEGFRSMAWEVRPRSADDYDSVFILRKSNEGRAVIAQFRVSSECGGV